MELMECSCRKSVKIKYHLQSKNWKSKVKGIKFQKLPCAFEICTGGLKVSENDTIWQTTYNFLSVYCCIELYLVPFSSYLMLKNVVTLTVSENGTIWQTTYNFLSVYCCIELYLVPFSSYLMLKNVVTLTVTENYTIQ